MISYIDSMVYFYLLIPQPYHPTGMNIKIEQRSDTTVNSLITNENLYDINSTVEKAFMREDN